MLFPFPQLLHFQVKITRSLNQPSDRPAAGLTASISSCNHHWTVPVVFAMPVPLCFPAPSTNMYHVDPLSCSSMTLRLFRRRVPRPPIRHCFLMGTLPLAVPYSGTHVSYHLSTFSNNRLVREEMQGRGQRPSLTVQPNLGTCATMVRHDEISFFCSHGSACVSNCMEHGQCSSIRATTP